MGVNYHCRDCLYCTFQKTAAGTIDRRTKKTYCEKKQQGTFADAAACDIYYLDLISGTGQFKRGGGIPEDAYKILNDESKQTLLNSEEYKTAADHHADR